MSKLTPRVAANLCLKRANRVLALARSLSSGPYTRQRNDLRRFALVMAVTALDTYMHRAIMKAASVERSGGNLPRALRDERVPISSLEELAKAVVEGRKKGVHTRPWVRVRNTLHRALLRRTFQSFDDIGRGMSQLGVQNGWSKVAVELGTAPAEIRERLNRIVLRRNQVVHEGDFVRQVRPQQVKYNSVDDEVVRDDVRWVSELLNAIDQVVLGR